MGLRRRSCEEEERERRSEVGKERWVKNLRPPCIRTV